MSMKSNPFIDLQIDFKSPQHNSLNVYRKELLRCIIQQDGLDDISHSLEVYISIYIVMLIGRKLVPQFNDISIDLAQEVASLPKLFCKPDKRIEWQFTIFASYDKLLNRCFYI